MLRPVTTLVLIVVLATIAPAAPAGRPTHDQDVLRYVTDMAGWHQRVVSSEPGEAAPTEVLFRDAVGRTSRQALDLAFEYARAEAARTGGGASPAAPAPATAPSSRPARGRRLGDASATAARRATQLRADLETLERQIATAAAPEAAPLVARRDRLAAELNLATARADAMQRMLAFREETEQGSEGGLLDQVDAIQRSIPAPAGPESAAAAASASAAPAASRAESAGVVGLFSQMFDLSRRMRALNGLAEEAASLRQAGDKLRAPLRAELMAATRRADAVGAANPAPGEAASGEPQDLEALATQFKQLSDAAVPLGRQSVLLDQARTSLLDWRALLGRQYFAVLRTLLVRVGVTGSVVVAIFVLSVLWRRATFRYVHDARRQRQFMLLRRLVVGCAVVVVAAFSFVTEFGSLATFVGILTAGIAVSLQTLILSGVAYFFFVGRYGVRVGDRVTIGGVTGEVLDTGLFRLHLMELGGSRRLDPTGRVVVFANSVLFQPSGFYKQVPGTNYGWHEVSLTLSPDSDHRLAEARLMDAAEAVFSSYRETIDRQHAAARRSGAVPAAPPRPAGRLRFVDAGLEYTLRYPVEISNGSEVEDRLTRALLAAIEHEPRLRLVPSATPVIQAAAAHA